MTIERIVRPFSSSNPFNPRYIVQSPTLQRVTGVVASSGSPENEVCELTWSGSNPGLFETKEPPVIYNFSTDAEEDDTRRVTTKKRVENPNDPEQYVTVQRIQSTVMTDQQTGREFALKFKNWDKQDVPPTP